MHVKLKKLESRRSMLSDPMKVKEILLFFWSPESRTKTRDGTTQESKQWQHGKRELVTRQTNLIREQTTSSSPFCGSPWNSSLPPVCRESPFYPATLIVSVFCLTYQLRQANVDENKRKQKKIVGEKPCATQPSHRTTDAAGGAPRDCI